MGFVTAHDHHLPLQNVANIMADVLPPKARISNHAKVGMQDLASEFIGFIVASAEAYHKAPCAASSGRRHVTVQHIIEALKSMGACLKIEPQHLQVTSA